MRMPGSHHGSPWGHACRVVELCPQEKVALAVEVTSPCPELQQNSSRVPPTSSAEGISFFYFTVNLSFFFFFSIKTQNWLETRFQGWHLAPRYISHPSGMWGRSWTHRRVPGMVGTQQGRTGKSMGGTWTPGTGPRAFIWHQQTPTQQFPPMCVGKWEREEPGPAVPRPPADAGRTSSVCPHSRDTLKPGQASPPRRQQPQELG